jgi:hypothetical protein
LTETTAVGPVQALLFKTLHPARDKTAAAPRTAHLLRVPRRLPLAVRLYSSVRSTCVSRMASLKSASPQMVVTGH